MFPQPFCNTVVVVGVADVVGNGFHFVYGIGDCNASAAVLYHFKVYFVVAEGYECVSFELVMLCDGLDCVPFFGILIGKLM